MLFLNLKARCVLSHEFIHGIKRHFLINIKKITGEKEEKIMDKITSENTKTVSGFTTEEKAEIKRMLQIENHNDMQFSMEEKAVMRRMMQMEEENSDAFIIPNESCFLKLDTHNLFLAIYHLIELGILKRRECDGTAYEWADNGREVFIDTLYASAFSPEMDCCFYKADFYGNENPSGSSFIPDKAVSIIIQTAASNPDTVRKELLLHALRYVYDEKEALEMYANCTCFQKIQEKHHHKCIDADTGIVTTSKSFDTDIFS